MSLYSLMTDCNNFFEVDYEKNDNFKIDENRINATNKNYKVGQYVRILDSILNDGVYKITKIDGYNLLTLDAELEDEEFKGFLIALAVPKDFIELSEKIDNHQSKFQKGISSENIPNYSISYDTNNIDYKTAFANELSKYKKSWIGKYYWLKNIA